MYSKVLGSGVGITGGDPLFLRPTWCKEPVKLGMLRVFHGGMQQDLKGNLERLNF
jgi:hypothetical protein